MASRKIPNIVDISITSSAYDLKENFVRTTGRAYMHVITWEEMEPHLEQCGFNTLECVELRSLACKTQQYICERQLELESNVGFRVVRWVNKKGERYLKYEHIQDSAPVVDFSKEDRFTYDLDLRVRTVVLNILQNRSTTAVPLQRGDLVRLEFVREKNLGSMFYDGDVLICAEPSGDENIIPGCFAVPQQFSLNYWDDCEFLGYAKHGDLTYDVAHSNFVCTHQWKLHIEESGKCGQEDYRVNMEILDWKDDAKENYLMTMEGTDFKEDAEKSKETSVFSTSHVKLTVLYARIYVDQHTNHHVMILAQSLQYVAESYASFVKTGRCYPLHWHKLGFSFGKQLLRKLQTIVDPQKTVVPPPIYREPKVVS